jgi:hypothetical protein
VVVQVAIQVSQRKSAKAVEAGFKMQSTNKAATLQLALSSLTRRAFRKESHRRIHFDTPAPAPISLAWPRLEIRFKSLLAKSGSLMSVLTR